MRLLKALICAAGLALPLGAPAPAPAQTWEGGYVGLQIARTSHIPRGFNTAFPTAVTYTGPQVDADTIALFAGYNWDMARSVVLGVEADANFGELTGEGPQNSNPNTFFSHSFSNVKSLRGRVGYDAGRLLPFVAFGVATADFAHGARNTGLPFTLPIVNSRISGTTLGVGTDILVGSRGFLRIEVNQTRFPNENVPSRTLVVPMTASDLHLTQARIGYALRF